MSILWLNRPHKFIISYPCQTDDRLKGWDVVYKVSPHGKLPVPNNEDYNIDPNTYDEEFFQEDGLEGSFEIDLTEEIGMEVDNERVTDEDAGDVVQNVKDLELLQRLHLGNAVMTTFPIMMIISTRVIVMMRLMIQNVVITVIA